MSEQVIFEGAKLQKMRNLLKGRADALERGDDADIESFSTDVAFTLALEICNQVGEGAECNRQLPQE